MNNSSVEKTTTKKKKSNSPLEPYRPLPWKVSDVTRLPIPKEYQSFTIEQNSPFSAQTKLFGPVSIDVLGALFWLTSRQQLPQLQTMGFYQQLRPCFSNKSTNNVHILTWNNCEKILQRYNPINHTLETINPIDIELLRTAQKAVEFHEGKVILLAEETVSSNLKFKYPTGQIWQDIHTIQGYLALAAEMLYLNYTSISTMGDLWVSQLDGVGRKLHSIGISVIGTRYFSM